MESKESVTKNIVRYASSKVYQQILSLLTAFIRPKLLSPELYGLLNILNIIPTYASYSNLGTFDIMRYMIPYHEGKKEHQKSLEIRDSVFYGTLFLNLFIVAGLIIFAFVMNYEFHVQVGLIAMAFVVIISWYYENFVVLLKSYQNFKLITSTFYLKATITFALTVVLIYFYKIYGAYLAFLLSFGIIALYLRLRYPSPTPYAKFKYSIFADLVIKGFPIMLYNFTAILINTSDRIIISYFLGTEQLGYYGIADMVLGFIIQIPGTAREVIEPRMMQDIYKCSMKEHLNEYFIKPMFHTAYLMPFLIGGIFFTLPVIIPLLLPKYTNGILCAQIVVFGSYFVAMSYTARGVIVAYQWQLRALYIMLFALLVNAAVSIFFIKNGLGIKGVAVGGSLSFCVMFIGLVIFVKISSNHSIQNWGKNIIGLSYPFLIMGASIAFLEYTSRSIQMDDYLCVYFDVYLAAGIKLFVYYAIMAFVIYRAQSKYPFLKIINLKKLQRKK